MIAIAPGISESFSDSGAALQRAQDKIASMQASATATDELLVVGVVVGSCTPDRYGPRPGLTRLPEAMRRRRAGWRRYAAGWTVLRRGI